MVDAGPGTLTDPTTFVFTDVVGSTKLWAADPDGTARSFVVHDAVVRSACKRNGGTIFGWAGDSFRAAFADRRAALASCAQIHAELAAADWRGDPALRVRIGVTHGQALRREGEYFGPVLNTAARLQEIAQPGQTVMGSAVAAGLGDIAITALGRHRVRDVADELELFQLGATGFAPLRTVDAALSTLPPSPGKLIGRATIVAEVRSALDDRRPVTLVGTGGAGKTRLALEVAHLELSDHPDGCYFVDLAAAHDDVSVGLAIARSSRIKLAGGDAYEQIADWFAPRRALLLLDNCEHVLDPVQRFVDELAMRAPDLGLLATSREPLAVTGERLVQVGPLPAVSDGGPAVELFVNRIRAEVPDFSPSTTELGQIVEICEHLDGIPLALELAAARSGILGLDHLLDGMHDRFRMLSSKQTDGTRTLREAIDWSYGLLSPDEQLVFVACGVFNGSFDLRAACAAVPDMDPLDVADRLHSLCRKSLVTSEGSLGGRFRLLETIRAYALLRLREFDLEVAVRDRHFEHFRRLAMVDDVAVANDLDRAGDLAAEWANLAAALDWGCTTERWMSTAELATGCAGLWETAVPAVEGRRWIDRVLPNLVEPSVTRALLVFSLTSLEAQLDNFPRVHQLLGELIDCDVPAIAANALALTGYLQARHDPVGGAARLDRCDAVISGHGLGHEQQAACWWARGALALYQPDLEAARRCFETGFEVARRAEHRTPNTVYTGLALAAVNILLGRPSDALATLDSYSSADSRWDSSPVLRAVALVDLGRAAEAAELTFAFAHESLLGRLARMSNDAMLAFAALALHRGEHDHAWTLLRQAVTPRTPFTIGLAEGLADRVGADRGAELRSMHRNREVALSELDAIDHLRAELDRLSDGVTARAGRTAIE